MIIAILGALSSKEDTERTPSQVVVDYLQNVHKMCRVASRLRKRGHHPFTPALDMLLGVVDGEWTEEEYRGLTTAFIPRCDAALVISDSWGTQRDIETAIDHNIPIYYNEEEIPDGDI